MTMLTRNDLLQWYILEYPNKTDFEITEAFEKFTNIELSELYGLQLLPDGNFLAV